MSALDLTDYASDESNPQGESLDLAIYWRLLLRRWPWVAILVVLGVGIGVVRYAISPKLYRATAQIQIEPRSMVSVSQDRNPWIDQWTNIKYFPTQYRLLRSRGLAKRVVDELRLTSDPDFAPIRSEREADKPYTAAEDELYETALASRLLGGLSVDPIEGTELLNLTYVGTDPRLVQRIANGFAEAFISWGIDQRAKTLANASRVLTNQIENLRGEVRELEVSIQEFSRDEEVVSTDSASSAASQALLRLSEQAATAMTTALSRQQRYRDLLNTPADVIAESSGRASIRRLESDLLGYERDYQTRLQTFKPDHPSMVELKAKVDETRRSYEAAIEVEAKAARTTAYNEWQAALRLVDSLDRQGARLQEENLTLSVDSLPLSNLQMELRAQRGRLAELVEQQSQAALSSGLQSDLDTRSNVHIIDRALLPGGAFKPSLRQNVALGGGLGLMAGIGLILLFHFMDRTLKNADELQRLLGLPVLAVIPDIGKEGKTYGYRAYSQARERKRAARTGDRPISIEMLPESMPRLAVSEAYRSLRTALLLSSAEDLRLITVTSAEAGEGKTATSTNLAIVMAQLGKRVLLLDADLRKPRLHKIFEMDNQQGLVNCLAGGDHPETLVRKTQVPGLKLLTSGPHPPNPSELLASDRMKQFLAWARGQFDFVIIDSPPVLAVSDAILPSSLSDGVVLCFRSHQIVRDAARSCTDQLRLAGIKVLGVVLNRYQPREGAYYDRRYQYYEAYAEASEASEASAVSEADSAA